MPALDVRLNPIRDTQFPLKEGVHKKNKKKQVDKTLLNKTEKTFIHKITRKSDVTDKHY